MIPVEHGGVGTPAMLIILGETFLKFASIRYPDSGGPTLRVISQPNCAVKPLRYSVLCLSELNGRSRFSLSRLLRPSSSGHKSTQLRGQGHFADPPYAFQS